MKKTLLIAAAGIISLGSNAQEDMSSLKSIDPQSVSRFRANYHNRNAKNDGYANKTTSAPRWYSWVNYFDTSEQDITSSIALTAPYLWRDTTAIMAFASSSGGTTWNHNKLASVAMAIDPSYSGFNNDGYYDGEMQVTTSDAYVVDSIIAYGRYGFNVSNTYVDTVRVSFVYGDGSSTADIYQSGTTSSSLLSRYGLASTDTLFDYEMMYNPATVTGTGTTVITKDILLDNTGASPAWGDTLTDGTKAIIVSLGDINIPAGNMIGATVSFLSGSPTFVANDTVFGSTMGYKYNMFRPYIAYRGTSSSPNYATYSRDNHNTGMFKTLPDTALGWGGQYIPLWYWSGSSSASQYQYPYIDFHIKCATCGVVSLGVNQTTVEVKANAYPNPASGTVNIPFTLSTTGDVTVTLSNMLGQTVESRKLYNVLNGKVVFNTTTLPNGIYTYSVNSSGQRVSGRVAVNN